MNTPKERPILFKAEMVRAILEGRKTQTRRTDKLLDLIGADQPAPVLKRYGASFGFPGVLPGGETVFTPCRFGAPGDRLWVKETFNGSLNEEAAKNPIHPADIIGYRADLTDEYAAGIRWRPSIFMPRWASRLTLEVAAVRVERLNDISEADAIAEGIEVAERRPEINAFGVKTGKKIPYYKFYGEELERLNQCTPNPIWSYDTLWEKINGPNSWKANPWVYVLEFRKL